MANKPVFDGDKYGYDQSYIQLKESGIWRKRLADVVSLGHSTGRLLDIGCNYGFFLRVCEPSFETYGVDASSYAIFEARKNVPESKLILCDVGLGLPFADESFDVVTAFDLLEHIPKYEVMLKDIHRILKPGGLFLLTTPNRWSMDSLLFGKDYWLRRDASHVVIFSNATLRAILTAAGFSRIRIRTVSFLHFLSGRCAGGHQTKMSYQLETSPQGWSSMRLGWLTPLVRGPYQLLNDLPTPWGANLYASASKPDKR